MFQRSMFLHALIMFFLIFSLQPASAQNENNFITDFFEKLFQFDEKQHHTSKELQAPTLQSPLFGKSAETRLEKAISYYENIVKRGGWKTIKYDWPLRLGDKDSKILDIRERLIATGDLREEKFSEELDQSVHDALVRFQTRHGLRNKGILGKQTFAALNVTAEVRLAQMRANLTRMRKLSAIELEERAIVVNVPSYELLAFKKGQIELKSKVIVGRINRQTPIFNTEIVGVNFFPKWRVPQSIAKRDLIPHVKKNPTYMDKEKYKLVRLSDGSVIDQESVDWNTIDLKQVQFQQEPGEQNALGLIRINMPNTHIVYLHDTPLKRLFKNSSRAYSSGCVRVQKINQVADWLLSTSDSWNENLVKTILQAREPVNKRLKKNVPVYFIYLTSWVSNNGQINFRPDIYSKKDLQNYMDTNEKEKPPLNIFSP